MGLGTEQLLRAALNPSVTNQKYEEVRKQIDQEVTEVSQRLRALAEDNLMAELGLKKRGVLALSEAPEVAQIRYPHRRPWWQRLFGVSDN